ncbi:aminotransferase class IV [uncultured Marinobacter sp.]|uniref:aminotransferase class IV n=1 Tax=uncultured Marinobacter sp. TaxID=187379 RepID=UPI0032B239A6
MLRVFWAEEGGLPAGDRGLAYGDGLFETIRMQGARGTLVGRHLERMARDAARLGIEVSPAALRGAFCQAAERYGAGPKPAGWVLKLILTRGEGGRGYRAEAGLRPHLLVSASALPPSPDRHGVCVDFSRVPLTVHPMLAGIKSLNRLQQVMAARELDDSLFEVLMLNAQGELVEGTRTNLVVNRDGAWITPPTPSLAVAGVMRQWLLETLRSRGEPVLERALSPDEVLDGRCRGLYLMNSVIGIVPVRQLAGHDLPVEDRLATICDPLETLE